MEITIRGVKIYISFLFVCLVALYILFTPTPDSVFFLLAILLHEAGHLTAMLLSGELPSSIELRSFGIKIIRRNTLLPSSREILILLAGPFVNLLLAAFFHTMGPALSHAALLNLMLALFNLIPVGCLDGGHILRCLLELHLSPRLSQSLFLCIAVLFLTVLLIAGLLLLFGQSHSPSLLITTIYLSITLFKDISE